MRFIIPNTDLRRDNSGSVPIQDEHGETVGQILLSKGGPSQGGGRTIILLGKYRGTFAKPEECEAFAKGVESVLTHMTSFKT
jgi:hypothetical protein